MYTVIMLVGDTFIVIIIYSYKYIYAYIKTHDSESRGQEEAAVRDE